MNKIESLKIAGLLYHSFEETENNYRNKMGGFLNMVFLLKNLIPFAPYSLKEKIEVLLKKTDQKRLFRHFIQSHRYKIFQDYYKNYLEPQKIFFTNNQENYTEKLRCLFFNAKEIYYLNYYYIDSLIKPHDRVIDAGANIGLFSIFVKELFPKTEILAFEPEENNFKVLKKNLASYNKIHFFNRAVGNKKGTKKLRIAINNLSHAIEDKEADLSLEAFFYKMQKVRIIDLDSVILKPVDIIKLDIEGYEAQALKGAKKLISKNQPLVISACEHSSHQRKNLIKIMRYINKKYQYIILNKNNVIFYNSKHIGRIKKLKKSNENIKFFSI